jgi:hypothetical protein
MCSQKVLSGLKYSIHYIIANGLEPISHLPAPIGPLARTMWAVEGPGDHDHHLTVVSKSTTRPTAILVFTATNKHMGLGKCAHHFDQYPTLRAITVVQLALPMQLETDRQVRRLAKHSHVSVDTKVKVNGPVKAVVQRESLSTPGGAIKFWLSDFANQDDAKCLPDEFTRPLHNEYVFFFSLFPSRPHVLTLCCSQGRQPSCQHHHPVYHHRLQVPAAVRVW